MLKQPALSFFFIILMASCGVETFQPIINLASPMGLTAVKTGTTIQLQFYSLNDEDYFTGYYIYIARTINELNLNIGHIVPNSEGNTNRPTLFNIPPMNSVQVFQKEVVYYTNNQLLQSGVYYCFFVKAYSEQYNVYSPPSNIAEMTNF